MLAIPEIDDDDITFGNIRYMPRYDSLPEDFRRHNGNDYCRAVTTWFFNGASIHPDGIVIGGVTFTAKPGIDSQKALRAIKAVLGSFEPKHEHKEAACAFMLSEWFDKS